MEHTLTVNVINGCNSYNEVECWVEKITDAYNLESFYFGSLSVLLDALVGLMNNQYIRIPIDFSDGEKSISFNLTCNPTTENEKANESFFSSFGHQWLEQLYSSYAISENSITFRIGSESLPINNAVKQKKHLLT